MVALRTNEMRLGDVMTAWGQRGCGPSVRGCNDGFGHKDEGSGGGDGDFGGSRSKAGRCNSGLGTAGIRWGQVRVALGTEWEGMMVTLGTVGTQRGGFLV